MQDLLRNLSPLLILCLALLGSVQAVAEPAVPAPGFTIAQLIKTLEKHFPAIRSGEGSLRSSDNLQSDLLASTNPNTVLETLGPPEALRSFVFSYDPGEERKLSNNRHWAGKIIRNALPDWREGKRWTHRATLQAEKAPGGPEISETAEGYRIAVSNADGRVTITVRPAAFTDTDPESLGISLSQLLAGLKDAFPERDEGMGSLIGGESGWISDRFFSDNAHAELETLGPADDLVGLRYLYALRDDHPEATADNRRYALTLVRNVFPDWAGADDWMNATIDKVAAEADDGASHVVIDHGPIRLRVRYFVGATAAIEVLIHPRDTFI
ncbi:hypothetical protein HBA54_07895 [Pelagibius litoralis]|uniref:Uncharacterized protein n=1 Tax=Pelagibius litoralis TaxID=374515 RepID=A0A967C2N9_9PROT|nr:hypothetical protein [Pelagibius litoralis]NIA68513.1 hypothetical protein [Pelagibius litoralis]